MGLQKSSWNQQKYLCCRVLLKKKKALIKCMKNEHIDVLCRHICILCCKSQILILIYLFIFNLWSFTLSHYKYQQNLNRDSPTTSRQGLEFGSKSTLPILFRTNLPTKYFISSPYCLKFHLGQGIDKKAKESIKHSGDFQLKLCKHIVCKHLLLALCKNSRFC